MDQNNFFRTLMLALSLRYAVSTSELTYSITVRDFLPMDCANFQSDGVQINQPFPSRSINGACPYQAALADGNISGHPDFDMATISGNLPAYFRDAYIINGDNGFLDLSSDAGRGDFEKTVENYTQIASSGIPKPVYCTSNSATGFNGTVRCGRFGNVFSTTNKEYFDMWFNDDIQHNKRIGLNLNLKSTGSAFEFKFDSDTDAENEFVTGGFYAPHEHLLFDEADFPNPYEVPNWPKQSILSTLCSGAAGRLWHTTEIHTFFQYRGNEEFFFSGDDDVWVFINGKLAIDLGGVHPRKDQGIQLGRKDAVDLYELEVGEIYTFDMFQAERRCSASNFELTTTLSDACNVVLSGKQAFDSAIDLAENKVKTSRGVKIEEGGSFLIIENGAPHSSNFLWIEEPINVGTGFIVEFDFLVSGLTEGFAFVLHRRPEGLVNLPISGGANLGFKGLTNSLAVVFDLCKDRDKVNTPCTQQQVSIHIPETPSDINSPSDQTRRVYDSVLLSLKTNTTHNVKIDYFFKPPALEVTLDGSLYLRQFPLIVEDIFESRGAYAGFTAATGDFADADVRISNFRIDAVDVEADNTILVGTENDTLVGDNASNFTVNSSITLETKILLADNIETAGFAVQSRDKCDNDIEFGARSNNTEGYYVEEVDDATGLYPSGMLTPRIIPAIVEDRNTGQYSYLLQTVEVGLFSLYLYYGNGEEICEFDFQNYTEYSGGANLTKVSLSLSSGSNSNCFFAKIPNAIQTVPLTPEPTFMPTVISLPPTVADDTLQYIATIGGSVLGVSALFAAFLAIVYRRRWQKDKQYIEEGQLYKLDATTNFDANDPLSVVGRSLLATRAAILRVRAQRQTDPKTKELNDLQTEQEDLIEQIRIAKQRLQQQQNVQQESVEHINPRFKPQKREF